MSEAWNIRFGTAGTSDSFAAQSISLYPSPRLQPFQDFPADFLVQVGVAVGVQDEDEAMKMNSATKVRIRE